jgi:uncharacterized protein (DUF58 family)
MGLVAVALYVVARTTGAGWVVVLLCGLVALGIVATVWPALALVSLGARVEAPRDATVDRPLRVALRLAGRARALRVRLVAPMSGWIGADAPADGVVEVLPRARGILRGVVVEVRASGPFGLVTWTRTLRASLDRPVEVAPREIPTRYAPSAGGTAIHDAPEAGESGDDLTRGVRELAPGDPIRLVHWPATARTGSVMVRELEGPRPPVLVVVADLRGDPQQVEDAASRAMGLVRAALDASARVDLRTAEVDGGRQGVVASALEAGRRLARAVPGAPPAGNVPAGAELRVIGAPRAAGA